MSRHADYLPHGVIPAILLPFNDDLSIDERAFRAHIRDVAGTEGISALTINAHSTEVASCTFDEQRRVLDIAQDEIGDRLPLVHGIWADGSLEAARIAKMAAAGGASALLVFPPGPFTLQQSPEMALAHFKRLPEEGLGLLQAAERLSRIREVIQTVGDLRIIALMQALAHCERLLVQRLGLRRAAHLQPAL
jgi:4-hydroxy-tetrahydrodipicolinate synthase